MSSAVYAGSFDPITNGHVAIIRSGLVAFDRIIVAVLTNTTKQPLFSVEDRVEMIRDALDDDPRVEVDRFEHGLLTDYASAKGVDVILRGLRAAGDYFFVSSTLVKEAASLGGDVKGVVPALVEKKLRDKFAR